MRSWVVGEVASHAGLASSHINFPGTHVQGFPIPPLRGWSVTG